MTEEAKRKQRALDQRVLLIRSYRSNSLEKEINFDVLGSRHDRSYVVRFDASCSWSCTCPDFLRRRSQCKHIFFILARVLGLSLHGSDGDLQTLTLPFIEQRLMQEHVTDQFRFDPNAPPLPSEAEAKGSEVLRPLQSDILIQPAANGGESVQQQQQRILDLVPFGNRGRREGVAQRPYLGEPCGICYEAFEQAEPEAALLYCTKTCGKTVHLACFTRYTMFTRDEICCYCRSEMKLPTVAGGGSRSTRRRRGARARA